MLHMIIGTLVDEGRLDPDAPAPCPSGDERTTRATPFASRDLLAMRDGLAFVEVYEIGETSHVIEMLFGEGKEDMAAFTAQLPLAHEPGTVLQLLEWHHQRAQSHRRRPGGLRRGLPRSTSNSDSSDPSA